MDRNGKDVIHNPTVPYMVPTVSFSEYLTDRLKVAVDAGVEAIHVEEPEFWDKSGYSEAFKREYEIYYKEPWKPQHESLDAQYKCARLKAYLYKRTIDRVSAGAEGIRKGEISEGSALLCSNAQSVKLHSVEDHEPGG